MLQQALQKIHADLAGNEGNRYAQLIGASLIDYVRNNPQHAAFFLKDGRSILGSLDAVEKEASKPENMIGNKGVLTPEEVKILVLEYFGIHTEVPKPAEAVPTFSVSLDDLL